MNKDMNRLKVVLAETKRTNRWLAKQLGKDQATVSKWCTNTSQPRNAIPNSRMFRCQSSRFDK